jgi:beta-glucosidase
VAPTGTLPVTWLKNVAQEPINVGDGQVPLFAFGHGLTYPAVPPPGRSARDTLRGESFSGQSGVQLEGCGEPGCGQDVGWITPGDYLYYDDVEFGTTSPLELAARIASDQSSGTMEARLDRLDGPLVASMPASPTGGWTAWITRTVPLAAPVTGRHRLYLVFTGPGEDFVNLEWFRFL